MQTQSSESSIRSHQTYLEQEVLAGQLSLKPEIKHINLKPFFFYKHTPPLKKEDTICLWKQELKITCRTRHVLETKCAFCHLCYFCFSPFFRLKRYPPNRKPNSPPTQRKKWSQCPQTAFVQRHAEAQMDAYVAFLQRESHQYMLVSMLAEHNFLSGGN